MEKISGNTLFSLKQINRFLIAMILILCNMSCQLPVQPTNVTIGVPTTVKILDQGNKLVSGANVDWKIIAPGASTSAGQATAMTETSDHGIFTAVIPLNITNDTSHVIFHVHAPQQPQYCYTPSDSSYTEIGYCGNKVFTYHVDTCANNITVCDPTPIGSAVNLLATLPTKTSDTAYTNTFTNNLAKSLVVTPASVPPLPPGPGVPFISISYSINGGPWAPYPPAPTVNPGQSIKFRFVFQADSSTNQSNESKYTVTFSGVDAQNDTCLRNVVTVDAKVQVQTLCDCPTGRFTYGTSASTCVNQSIFDTVDLSSIHNGNTKCNLEFAATAQSNSPDNEVSIFSSPVPGLLLPGNSLSKFIIKFTPGSKTTFNREYDYTITRISLTGTRTVCDSILRIKFTGIGDAPSCAIDMTSPVLNQATDTLRQLLDIIKDPAGSTCLKIYNKSKGCSLTINIQDVSITASKGSQSTPFYTNLPLTIAPTDSGCLIIDFRPTDNDVWPPNGQRGGCGSNTPPTNTFNAQITLSNNCPISFPIVGVVDPPPYNPPSLNVYSPKNINGIFLGISNGQVLSRNGIIDSLPMWLKSVNYTGIPNTSTAVLASGNPPNISYINYHYVENIGDISTLGQTIANRYQNYSTYCGCPGTDTITIHQYDVIMISYTYAGLTRCAVLYITDITTDTGTLTGTPHVNFQICFPI